MSKEININKIEWEALEYKHKEHSPDWYWTIGLITLIVFIVVIWIKSYLFGIFIIISGASLILINLRHPQKVNFSIETSGLIMGKDKYEWEKIKSFNIKKNPFIEEKENKLLIETSKHFLPIYTIPIPKELVPEIKESLLKFIPQSELNESQSLQFMEKIGF